ncbi:MAG: nucleotidyl transferase AbiEii/AbiGii toxin family protein [Candidatus Omnitrophota bacterium]
MKYQHVFQLLSDISKKKNITFVLIGGFAVSHYKYARQTMDVDFLITKDDFEKILPLLEKLDYKIDYNHEVFSRLASKDGLLMMDLDFMFVDAETLAKIVKDSQRADIAGCEFMVPSLENLIALKLHALKYNPKTRLSKDVPDIINLIKINKFDVKSEKFRELCLKFASEEIYRKILDGLDE